MTQSTTRSRSGAGGGMQLDEAAIQRAREQLSGGAVTPSVQPYAKEICKLLNDSLATELVCVMRYRRHFFTAKGLNSKPIADEFMVHAEQELHHADLLAERIVQLGGLPDFNPDSLSGRSHAEYNDDQDLRAMIRSNLEWERVACEVYRQMVQAVGDKDPTTQRMLKEILAEEEEHADDMSDWLEKV